MARSPTADGALNLSEEVADALRDRRPVVALESTVLTHGLPRVACELSEAFMHAYPAWNHTLPANLAAALSAEKAVRGAGAVPATIALIDGRVHVGLSHNQLERITAYRDPAKLSMRDLGAAIALGRTGGTTVASTAALAAAAGISLFATGGIGGVHRGWHSTLDVSADLEAIARHRVLVVCAGAKVLLDLPATLEALETLGVPTLGYQGRALPRFTVAPDPNLLLHDAVDSPTQAAKVARAHWSIAPACGMLLMQSCPSQFALPAHEIEAALESALAAANAQGIRGAATTPFLLAHLAQSHRGDQVPSPVLEANLALLFANAALAAEVSSALATD